MTAEQLIKFNADRISQLIEMRKMEPIQEIKRSDIVGICAAMELVVRLYQQSGRYDELKSFDARATLWDIMNDYNITDAELEAHRLFTDTYNRNQQRNQHDYR